jgi:hypothetical protein
MKRPIFCLFIAVQRIDNPLAISVNRHYVTDITGSDLFGVGGWLRDAPALPPQWLESAMDKPLQSQNYLLASLPSADFELLRPHLRVIELLHEKVLSARNQC